jgi:O-antigen/teichoic acid export membrane protein
MSGDIVELARRYLLSLGGEGLQSGFHFALNLLLIRLMSAYDYGVFAIVFILGGISLNYGNALVSLPANIHIARAKSVRAANFDDVVFGSVALSIGAAACLVVAIGLFVTIRNPGEAIAGGLFVALWTLRNHVRNVMFARQAMATAVLADFSYAAFGAALVGALFWLRPDAVQATSVLLTLAVANVVGIAVALAARRRRLRVSFGRSVRRRYAAVWRETAWSLVWVTAWNVQGQGLMFLVAAIVGPAGYAPIAAGLVLFGPLRPALGALLNVVRPIFAAGLAEHRDAQIERTLLASIALAVVGCVAFGAAVWFAWPVLTAHVYGEKFADASMPLIVTLAWLNALAYVTYAAPLALVQAARQFKAAAVSAIVGGIVGMSLVTFLLMVSTVAWSLVGAVAGETAALIAIGVTAWRILRAPRPAQASGSYASRTPEWPL